MDFPQEQVHSGEALYIARLAPDYGALVHRFGGEEVMQPDLGREGRLAVLHGVSMRDGWLRGVGWVATRHLVPARFNALK